MSDDEVKRLVEMVSALSDEEYEAFKEALGNSPLIRCSYCLARSVGCTCGDCGD
jgi:hypothetical protein